MMFYNNGNTISRYHYIFGKLDQKKKVNSWEYNLL